MGERRFNPENAHRLDSEERRVSSPPDDVLAHLPLDPGMAVADIGAGTGFFARPIAHRIRPGRVYAVDIQPEMLAVLQEKLSSAREFDNVLPSIGDAQATGLSTESIDLAFLANLWHELDDLGAVLTEARRILRASGTLAILDWSPSASSPPGPPADHRIPESVVCNTLVDHKWDIVSTHSLWQTHYLVIARAI